MNATRKCENRRTSEDTLLHVDIVYNCLPDNKWPNLGKLLSSPEHKKPCVTSERESRRRRRQTNITRNVYKSWHSHLPKNIRWIRGPSKTHFRGKKLKNLKRQKIIFFKGAFYFCWETIFFQNCRPKSIRRYTCPISQEIRKKTGLKKSSIQGKSSTIKFHFHKVTQKYCQLSKSSTTTWCHFGK